MAGPKGSKYYDIFLNHNVWLETRGEDVVISAEGLDLLVAVEEVSSIVTAAKNLKISYRKAWGLLREVEDMIGFKLIEKHRGGIFRTKRLYRASSIFRLSSHILQQE